MIVNLKSAWLCSFRTNLVHPISPHIICGNIVYAKCHLVYYLCMYRGKKLADCEIAKANNDNIFNEIKTRTDI